MHIEPGSQSIRLRDGRINKKTLAILQCSTKTYAKLESKTDCIISHKKCQSSYHSIPSPSGELKTIHEHFIPTKTGFRSDFRSLKKRHLKNKTAADIQSYLLRFLGVQSYRTSTSHLPGGHPGEWNFVP